jgi:threonine dehydrogenase-like Zn-dependent dehydrogenase
MRAAFVKTHNKIKIVDIPVPKPEENEVLVKIDACGVCGSDFI